MVTVKDFTLDVKGKDMKSSRDTAERQLMCGVAKSTVTTVTLSYQVSDFYDFVG